MSWSCRRESHDSSYSPTSKISAAGARTEKVVVCQRQIFKQSRRVKKRALPNHFISFYTIIRDTVGQKGAAKLKTEEELCTFMEDVPM